MKRLTTLLYFIGLMSLVWPRVGQSQSAFDAIRIVQDEIGFDARALGMGGAFTAVANDYSAIYWNPAGLAGIQQTQFFGELSHRNFNNAATFNQRLTETDQNFTRLRSVGIAFPLPTSRGSFVLSAGYNRVKDFDSNLLFQGFNEKSNGLGFDLEDDSGNSQFYPFDRNVFQEEQVSDEGGLNQWSVGAGMALSPNFNAGITLTYWTGNSDYQLEFFQEDRDNIYNQFPADYNSYRLTQTILADYDAFSVKLGGLMTVVPGVRIGAALGLPTTFRVQEVFSQRDQLAFDDGFVDESDLGSGEFEYKVRTPLHFDGGISFTNQLVLLSGSFRYRDWRQTRFKIPEGALGDPDFESLLEENNIIRRDYRATLAYRLGGELRLRDMNTTLRAGYAVEPSPLKNVSSDRDRTWLTFGAGFDVDRYVRLDVAYLRGSWKQLTEDPFTPGGTLEDIRINKFLIGFTYRF